MAMLRILSMGRVPRNEEGEYGRGQLPRQLEDASRPVRVFAIERERAPLKSLEMTRRTVKIGVPLRSETATHETLSPVRDHPRRISRRH